LSVQRSFRGRPEQYKGTTSVSTKKKCPKFRITFSRHACKKNVGISEKSSTKEVLVKYLGSYEKIPLEGPRTLRFRPGSGKLCVVKSTESLRVTV